MKQFVSFVDSSESEDSKFGLRVWSVQYCRAFIECEDKSFGFGVWNGVNVWSDGTVERKHRLFATLAPDSDGRAPY